MTMEKNVCGDMYVLKKMSPPPPSRKNNGLSLSVLSYSVTTFAQLRVIVPVD